MITNYNEVVVPPNTLFCFHPREIEAEVVCSGCKGVSAEHMWPSCLECLGTEKVQKTLLVFQKIQKWNPITRVFDDIRSKDVIPFYQEGV